MTPRRMIERDLGANVSAELGRWGLPAETDEVLGACVYRYASDTCSLGLFTRGLTHQGDSLFRAAYEDIEQVDLLVLRELVILKGPWATALLRLRVADTLYQLPIPYVIYSPVGPLMHCIVTEKLWLTSQE